MSVVLERFRQSGRTTRMIEYAVALAGVGRTVVVLVHDVRAVPRMQTELNAARRPGTTGGFQVGTLEDYVTSGRVVLRTLQWARTRDEALLIDHYAVEQLFSGALSQWARFLKTDDMPAPPQVASAPTAAPTPQTRRLILRRKP